MGKWITGSETTISFPSRLNVEWVYTTLFGSWEVFTSLLIGGLALGIPMSLAAYFLSYFFLIKSKKAIYCINSAKKFTTA